MPTPLTRTSWPLGWNPSQDASNGDPNGLLRMDNLQLDETGVLSLARGNTTLNAAAFSDYIDRIYTKTVNGTDLTWIALNRSSVSIRRSTDKFASNNVEIATMGGERAAFADCLGQILITAGDIKKKDDGTTVRDLGLITPGAGPTVDLHNQPVLELWHGTWSLIEGHDIQAQPDDLSFDANVDSDTLRAAYRQTYASPVDTTNIDTGAAADPGFDTFQFIIRPQDTSLFRNIRVEFILDDDPTLGKNYYWIDIPVDLTQAEFRLGLDVYSSLSVQRNTFTRQGSDATLDWTHVTAINFIATAISDVDILMGEPKFVGGLKGQLLGLYQYAQQDVADNGVYQAKSPLVANDAVFNIFNGYTTITPNPTIDSQVTHHWIYRRSALSTTTAKGVVHTAADIGAPVLLDQWYRIAVTPVNTPVDDTLGDLDALEENVTANLFLESIKDITDPILAMEGLFNERMLYLTKSWIYLSDRLNPDAIDTRYTVKAFGDPTEKNLWLKIITNAQLLLATTKDLYEIAGTLLDLPDGTLDIAIRAVGEQYPPLSSDCALTDGKIFYPAADGIRVSTGSNSTLLSTQLNLLFQGEARHGFSAISISANDTVSYPIAVGRTRLYASLPLTDGRKLFVFDLIRQTWRTMATAPLAIHTTQTDDVLLGYGDAGDNHIRQFETGTASWDFELRTIYDHNGQPRNRKDTFTLKIIYDSGGVNVAVSMGKNGGAFAGLGNINSNGQATAYINVEAQALGFRYAFKLTGTAIATFKLYEITLEYDPRPEQVNYLRIPNTNLGSYARKRFTNFAFVIDTLGGDVTFTPVLDGTNAVTTSNVNKSVKLTHIHYFTQETIATDIGGFLQSSGAPFEYYGPNLEETVSEKLPTPVKFLVIPASDYGSPNRKRHTSYKFQINTLGADVRFTPILDGVPHTPSIANTSAKRTHEHFFEIGDIIGIDIGGTLESLADTEFEFYHVIVPQQVEVLPPRLKTLYINTNNFGVAQRKRVRTLPIIIDTYSDNVTFTPVVDGIAVLPSSTLLSTGKRTLYHYFTSDVFGVDFSGALLSQTDNPFEFYGFGNPENVEVLPVPKKYDQLQPMRFDKIGKLFAFRTRLIMLGSTIVMPFKIFGEEQFYEGEDVFPPLYSGTFPVAPSQDNVYEIKLPKNINGTIFRIVLGPTDDAFHRYDLLAKVSLSGMESDSRWMPTR